MRMHKRQTRPTRGFTLIELVVTIAVISVLIALLLPAVQQARESARRTQCRSRLKQLCLALHNYHSAHNILPPGSLTVGPAFRAMSGWGWGSMILPYLDQAGLYHLIDFSSNNAVGANRTAAGSVLSFWFCPSDTSPGRIMVHGDPGDSVEIAAGNYLGVESMLSEISAVRFSDVSDGLSATFLLSEHRYQHDETGKETTSSWVGRVTFQNYFVFDSVPHGQATALTPVNKSVFSSRHTGGAFFGFGDGSVHFISEHIDLTIYEALGTRSGGEIVDVPF